MYSFFIYYQFIYDNVFSFHLLHLFYKMVK